MGTGVVRADLVDHRVRRCDRERTLIGQLYRGYSISPAGSIIGLIWAFFDGLTGGTA